jgi:hypothetical protein
MQLCSEAEAAQAGEDHALSKMYWRALACCRNPAAVRLAMMISSAPTMERISFHATLAFAFLAGAGLSAVLLAQVGSGL